MKNIIYILFILFANHVQGQKVIEKNLDYSGQFIHIDVKFASHIEVKTWDKSSIYFKADITTEEGKYLDAYELEIEERTDEISINEQAKPIFKKFREEWEKEKKNKNYYNNEYEFKYVVHIPSNAEFKISSINGDLSSELIQGKFTADLINGNIEIDKYSGELDLKTINGEIDLKMTNTELLAETIHGDIYADENLDLKSYDRHVGQKISGSIGTASNQLRLNTINGNMYIRK